MNVHALPLVMSFRDIEHSIIFSSLAFYDIDTFLTIQAHCLIEYPILWICLIASLLLELA